MAENIVDYRLVIAKSQGSIIWTDYICSRYETNVLGKYIRVQRVYVCQPIHGERNRPAITK